MGKFLVPACFKCWRGKPECLDETHPSTGIYLILFYFLWLPSFFFFFFFLLFCYWQLIMHFLFFFCTKTWILFSICWVFLCNSQSNTFFSILYLFCFVFCRFIQQLKQFFLLVFLHRFHVTVAILCFCFSTVQVVLSSLTLSSLKGLRTNCVITIRLN